MIVLAINERTDESEDALFAHERTFTSSGFPQLPSLKVTRMWLFVGRNSNPSSSHGVSSLAVPGFALADVDDNLRF